jgi:alanyl-tRNA synthetase
MTGNEKNAAPAASGQKKVWSGNDIREAFLRFFESKGHRRVRSSSLVPHGDPTLLFTNAGMNQFKDVFLGLEKRDYNRATTAQKCVRAGGKHNDLENVGFTKRHHTFFEMLGNFSFGDYFKDDAIAFAWELVTSPQWFGIPKDKLYVTIFEGAVIPHADIPRDTEAYDYWLDVGVSAERIFELGMKENFWQMGDTGPCGPCSEIHYDMGSTASEQGHMDCKFPCDCGRYVEIWNLVFMQYDRKAGVKDGVPWYEFSLLPKPCVDTGMGLERVAAVLQGVISNYETDLFAPLIAEACKIVRVMHPDTMKSADTPFAASLRVIADHSRAATFLIADGVVPSNEGRGYVLRKIVRRALTHANFLGAPHPFLSKMSEAVRREMRTAYPEIEEAATRISRVLDEEEQRFIRTLQTGLARLERLIAEQTLASLSGSGDLAVEFEQAAQVIRASLKERELWRTAEQAVLEITKALDQAGTPVCLSGEAVFPLYDTYGLSRDSIEDSTRDARVKIDWKGFEKALEEQRTRARASWKGAEKEAAKPVYVQIARAFRTEPDFYFSTSTKDCRIEAIVKAGTSVSQIEAGESGEVVLDRTVIYAESGGQVADTGAFYDNSESQQLAEVKGAFYPVAGLVAHRVIAKDTLRVGDRVAVVADAERRARIIRNHSGTHLVHAALRNILGTHVKQAGSLNAPERLRFDFSHFAHVDAEELRDIEQQVNDEIRLNTQIETNVTSLEDALASGALAFFGDKYPESNVRVVTIPDPRAARGFYSKELCGGTHVQRVGDIGVLKIVSEESVAAGVRRIEAVTGIAALEHFQRQALVLTRLVAQLNVGEDAVLAQVEKLTQTAKTLEKELESQKRKDALGQVDELFARVQTVKGVKLIAAEVQNVDREGLRQLVDTLRQKLGSGVVALGMPEDGKVALIAGVTKDLTSKVHAGKLMQALAPIVGGKGGGRPDLAEAGGKDTAGLKLALQSVPSLLEPLL